MVKRRINTKKRSKKYNKTKKKIFNKLNIKASAKAEQPKKRRKNDSDKKSDASSDTIPDYIKCPISLEIMKDPVIAEDGHTYDREEITKACRDYPRSPMNRQIFTSCNFITNRNIRDAINKFLKDSGRDELDPPQETRDGFSGTFSIVWNQTSPEGAAAAVRRARPRGAVGQRRPSRNYTPPHPTTDSSEEGSDDEYEF